MPGDSRVVPTTIQIFKNGSKLIAITTQSINGIMNELPIRSARLYKIGKFTPMGGTVIIEAKDKDKKELGSFVTGFMPFACE